MIVALSLILPATQLQANKPQPPLRPVGLVFIEPIKPVLPPDYKAIRAASDARLAQEAAQAAYVAPAAPVQATGDCVSWLQQLGVTDIATAMLVINRESGCNPYALNPSGACGIPQDIRGCEVGYDPVAQLRWMLNYVNARYGGWAGAWAHELAVGWY